VRDIYAGRRFVWRTFSFGTVTLPPPLGPTLLDSSLIDPRCPTHVAAALMRGAATSLRDRRKCQAHAGHLHPGYTFVPASTEAYRHLGKPIMRYLCTFSDTALVRSLVVTQELFLASADRELGVALVQSQGYVYHSYALLLAKASGR
jgi:hypothetical protein